MTNITYEQFMVEVKAKIDPSRWGDVDSNSLFFKLEDTYLALKFIPEKNMLWLSWVIGSGLAWSRAIRQACLKTNVQFIGFVTKTDNKSVLSIAKYWNAQMFRHGDEVEGYINLSEVR